MLLLFTALFAGWSLKDDLCLLLELEELVAGQWLLPLAFLLADRSRGESHLLDLSHDVSLLVCDIHRGGQLAPRSPVNLLLDAWRVHKLRALVHVYHS